MLSSGPVLLSFGLKVSAVQKDKSKKVKYIRAISYTPIQAILFKLSSKKILVNQKHPA